MSGEFIVRGVPSSLVQDSWWLSSDITSKTPPPIEPPSPSFWKNSGRKSSGALLALVVLVSLADWLFWSYAPGLSVAIFSWALFGATLLLRMPEKSQSKPALLFLLLTSLPVIEHYQSLSMAFQLFGLITATAWIHLPRHKTLSDLPEHFRRLLVSLPGSGLRALLVSIRSKPISAKSHDPESGPKPLSNFTKHFRNWSFPLGGALVLITLLLRANPVLEQSLVGFMTFDFDVSTLFLRTLFWSGTALIIWPFLVPDLHSNTSKPNPKARDRSSRLTFGLNAGSVLRALVIFNMILAVQSAMDMSILFGGAELPEGMSMATYAHRGAYPLLITAMLAGGFALAARPYLASHVSLKPLMMLWLGQNALLGLTSVLRLDLYVANFGLTYLRLYAMIWIGLVVTGLLLTAWQIHKERTNSWLLLRCVSLGLVTLYLCGFVNFAALIAKQNLSMASTQALDWYYLCTLGPVAADGIQTALTANADLRIPSAYASCWQPHADPANWREWGFRSWRISSYAGAEFINSGKTGK